MIANHGEEEFDQEVLDPLNRDQEQNHFFIFIYYKKKLFQKTRLGEYYNPSPLS